MPILLQCLELPYLIHWTTPNLYAVSSLGRKMTLRRKTSRGHIANHELRQAPDGREWMIHQPHCKYRPHSNHACRRTSSPSRRACLHELTHPSLPPHVMPPERSPSTPTFPTQGVYGGFPSIPSGRDRHSYKATPIRLFQIGLRWQFATSHHRLAMQLWGLGNPPSPHLPGAGGVDFQGLFSICGGMDRLCLLGRPCFVSAPDHRPRL